MPGKWQDTIVSRETCELLARARKDLVSGRPLDPLVMQMDRGKKPGDIIPFKLTLPQRETLLACLELKPKLRQKLKEAGDGVQVLELTDSELAQQEQGLSVVFRHGIGESQHRPRVKAILNRIQEK